MDKNQLFEDVFTRLLKVTGAKTDSALARILDIKPQSVVAARKRKQIPPGWIVAIAQEYGVTTDWLFFGAGPMRAVERFNGAGDAAGKAEKEPSVLTLQQRLEQQAEQIRGLEKQLSEAKEEILKAYRLAVEAMRAPVDAVQVPPPPRYGHSVGREEEQRKPNTQSQALHK